MNIYCAVLHLFGYLYIYVYKLNAVDRFVIRENLRTEGCILLTAAMSLLFSLKAKCYNILTKKTH
jgi:hypothetical protein